jgi:hypothetical protein
VYFAGYLFVFGTCYCLSVSMVAVMVLPVLLVFVEIGMVERL